MFGYEEESGVIICQMNPSNKQAQDWTKRGDEPYKAYGYEVKFNFMEHRYLKACEIIRKKTSRSLKKDATSKPTKSKPYADSSSESE